MLVRRWYMVGRLLFGGWCYAVTLLLLVRGWGVAGTLTSVRPSARPSVRPSVRPSAHLSVRPFVLPPVRPPVRPSVRPPVRLSVRPPVRPSVRWVDWDHLGPFGHVHGASNMLVDPWIY